MSEVDVDNWYTKSPIVQQGSIAFKFPVIQTKKGESAKVLRRKIDAVVLTQSCDIGKSSQESLLVAEIQDYMELYNAGGSYLKETGYRKALARGTSISDFLLPPDPWSLLNWSIVNFRNLYVVDSEEFSAHHGSLVLKVGLASPYVEHLSQAYARFMMRVGLPIGLQAFEELKFGSWT